MQNKTLEGDPYQRFCCVLAASFGSCLDACSLSGDVTGIASAQTFASENMTHEERLRAVFAQCTNAGASEASDVSRVEAELGVSLPPSYRSFLSEFGASLLVAPYAIAGIDPNRIQDAPPMFSDVVADTRRIRASAPNREFDHLVFISSDGMSNYLYLDTSRHDDSGECPVVVIAPGVDREDVAASFVEFAESVLAGDPLERVS